MQLPWRMPAEWHPASAIWLAWPHKTDTWPGHFENVPPFFARLAVEIARTHPVWIVADKSLVPSATELIRRQIDGDPSSGTQALMEIRFLETPTDDCWIRDYGPVFTLPHLLLPETSGELLPATSGEVSAATPSGDARDAAVPLSAVHFRFNAWGGKYQHFQRDAAAGPRIADHVSARLIESPLCAEGGALETDGNGRLLVCETTLVGPTRNPGMSKEAIAEELYRTLGVTEIVWLGESDPSDSGSNEIGHKESSGEDANAPPISGDDTDGHIDQLARFLDPYTVVVATADHRHGPSQLSLQKIRRQLITWGRQTEPAVTVIDLPMPAPRFIDGQAVPQSYCNFLRLGPDRILMPTFRDREADAGALDILRGALPTCQIDPVDCFDLAWGLGALHCASLHQPAVTITG
ncbi:agmatine deiminase family protein [Crateriforma conspicua]|uniref:Putative agmatine deiminase n=1 Tax=Crateriforma conspicua TaxID=2527996 RepID=A0A5C5YA04_9PLAN|nr:agmatine deiminase family protein [Crateriforma conspicua]TWT71653.1 putative agmatine deiminase [Crateriforma conspicua]